MKMKRIIKLLVMMLCVALLLDACEGWGVYLPIDEKGTTQKVIQSSCGKVTLDIYNWGWYYYQVDFHFNLDKQMDYHPDSLTIKYGDCNIPFTFTKGGPGIETENSELVVNRNGYIAFVFEITEEYPLSDTIWIYDNGFLYCDDQKVPVGTTFLIPNNK